MAVTENRTAYVDAVPLVTALQRIVEAGRKRKLEDGVDDAAVQYARLAAVALDWRAADEAGDLDEAKRLIEKLHTMNV